MQLATEPQWAEPEVRLLFRTRSVIPTTAAARSLVQFPRFETAVCDAGAGTNSGDFTVSRKGDCGNRLAAGEILPPFCVYRNVLRRLRQGSGKWQNAAKKPLWSPFVKKTSQNFWRELKKLSAFFYLPTPFWSAFWGWNFRISLWNEILKIPSLWFRKTQNVQQRQKKIDENGKNLSFAACNFIYGNFISWRLDARISQKL